MNLGLNYLGFCLFVCFFWNGPREEAHWPQTHSSPTFSSQVVAACLSGIWFPSREGIDHAFSPHSVILLAQ